jgi:hypothetical protein
MKNTTQFTLRNLLALVLFAALATAWLRERFSHHGLLMRIEKLEHDISVLAMIINRNHLSIPENIEYSKLSPGSRGPSVQDEYTQDELSRPPH